MSQVLGVAGAVTLMLAFLAATGRACVWLWQTLRSIARLADDLTGEPARGLQPARPGILDRLATLEALVARRMDSTDARIHGLDERLGLVEAQLRPNGGGSLRDAVDRLAPTTPST